jgi:predicted ATP-dependent protease
MPNRRPGAPSSTPSPDSKPRARSAKSGRGRGSEPGPAAGAAAPPERAERVETTPISSIPPSINAPVKAWLDANLSPLPGSGRDPFKVSAEQATQRTDPSILPETPAPSGGLFELLPPIARRALALGLAAREPSFHVFVSAHPEVMIEDDIVRFAERFAKGRPTPPDIVYVHDFDKPEAPKPLSLPAGAGGTLVAAMDALIDRLREEIPGIAAHDEVRRATQKLARDLESKNKEVLTGLESTAKNLGFGIRTVQGGLQTFPILHGKPLSAEQFGALDESTKRALGEAEDRLTAEVEKAAGRVREQSDQFDAAREEAMSRLSETVIRRAMEEMKKLLADFGDDVAAYLEGCEKALIEDWIDFVESTSQMVQGEDGHVERVESSGEGAESDPEHATRLSRFKVNLLVAHEEEAPPPVIYETNPTYPNLFGYLERRARFGALLTDFTRIRPGSLHNASGGVLIVRATDLMTDPIIWERMKRVLRERRIGAEDPLGPLGLYATTLRPVPVPVRVRVVLVGAPDVYATLLDADPDFAALFRVKVEVEHAIQRNAENLRALDSYLMTMAESREWGVFDRPARARLLDLATRLAGDRQRLSVFLSPLEETAAFAGAVASARAAGVGDWEDSGPLSLSPSAEAVVTVEDVETAWRERKERAGAAERHIRELTLRGEVSLDTEGFRVGVVNGLSVYSAGDVEFGQPMRITAVVALGREGIVDVEHEAQLGGAIHTKGVAIIRGYLARQFGQERPLSLKAQIAFEQSYGEIDGDSASSTELYGVLSALAEIPIDQGIAVTGSVNQLGEIQAIGGVCAKIEGFFELCKARGLNGRQGVMLPRANLEHLVLREDVARAIAEGQFHLYAVQKISEGIEIMTGVPAGERDPSGRFPAGSVFGRVERRIIEIAERLRVAEGHGHVPPDRDSMTDVSHADLGEAGDYRPR